MVSRHALQVYTQASREFFNIDMVLSLKSDKLFEEVQRACMQDELTHGKAMKFFYSNDSMFFLKSLHPESGPPG